MNSERILYIFNKDLDRLREEIAHYPSDASLWIVNDGINNSAGTLAIHILGSLQHFIGTVVGGSDYVRDRPAEFSSTDIPKAEIFELIDTTKNVIQETLSNLSEERVNRPYPLEVAFGPPDMTTLQALVIMAAHLNYHLGQINYHRRLLV